MVRVRFPPHLRRHFPVPAESEFSATTVAGLVQQADVQFPGLAAYLIHEDGSLRKHVNIFIGEHFIRDRQRLTDKIPPGETVFVMQALSGG